MGFAWVLPPLGDVCVKRVWGSLIRPGVSAFMKTVVPRYEQHAIVIYRGWQKIY
jgi:hypothetical protein